MNKIGSILNFIKKNQLCIAILVLTILLFLFTAPILKNLCINEVDDIFSIIDPYPLWKERDGRHVANIIGRFFTVYFPTLLGIHLQNAANTIGMVMYTLILSSLFSITSLFYFLNSRNIIAYIFLWLFTGYAFLNYTSSDYLCYWTTFHFQYGYVLAVFFTFSFLWIIYKYLDLCGENKQIECTAKRSIFLCILAFCAGNSTQIATYSIFVILFLLSFLFLIKNKFDFSKTKKELFNKITTPVLISYLAGFLLMVTCPGFWIEVSWRHTSSIHQVFLDLVPFMKDYFNVLIMDFGYSGYYKIIGVLSIALFLKNIHERKSIIENITNIIIIILPIISVLAFFFTTILGGRTFGTGGFWIIEPFYHFYYVMVLWLVISLFIGKLFKNNCLYNNFIILVFLYILYTNTFSINIDSILDKQQELSKALITRRQEVYECEKIVMTELYQNEEVILPEIHRSICNMYLGNLPGYIKKAYNWEIINFGEVKDSEIAMEHFYSIGGTITEEEKEKADFQKLLDKNFVLNGK